MMVEETDNVQGRFNINLSQLADHKSIDLKVQMKRRQTQKHEHYKNANLTHRSNIFVNDTSEKSFEPFEKFDIDQYVDINKNSSNYQPSFFGLINNETSSQGNISCEINKRVQE